MRRKLVYLFVAVCSAASLQAQEYRWKLVFDYFFDNQEYEKSSFIDPQTMNGIWLNPLAGISWDATHTIYSGVNLLKIPGMKEAVDKVDVTLYYQYETPKVLFRAGAFPRKEVLPNYSDFFFKDSVNHFMPLMQGVFCQIGKERNFLNAWMDWTGYATPDTRENFYVGFSGKGSTRVFFGDFQSCLFHYAGTYPGNPAYGVSEQMQVMASLGVERLLDSDRATVRLNGNLHFSEGRMLFQQTMSVAASIDNCSKRVKTKVSYPWMNLFR